jgi:hypothetical protein
MEEVEEKELGFGGLLDWTSFFGPPGLDMFISLSHGGRGASWIGHVHFSFARPKEKQNQRERPPA